MVQGIIIWASEQKFNWLWQDWPTNGNFDGVCRWILKAVSWFTYGTVHVRVIQQWYSSGKGCLSSCHGWSKRRLTSWYLVTMGSEFMHYKQDPVGLPMQQTGSCRITPSPSHLLPSLRWVVVAWGCNNDVYRAIEHGRCSCIFCEHVDVDLGQTVGTLADILLNWYL